jgi:hypothetical protein
MVSEKAWYWIAVGVLALMVSNNFAARHQDAIRCLASQSLASVEQVSGHTTHFMAMAEVMLGRGGASFARTQTTLARAQTRLASVQTAMACREAAFARLQEEHARITTMQELGGAVVCPRQNLRLALPQLPREGTI